MQVTGVTEGDGTETDAYARLVHHVEHVDESFAFLADERANGSWRTAGAEASLAEIEQAVDGAPIAHLVVEPAQHDVVSFADLTARSHEEFRHDEKGYPTN